YRTSFTTIGVAWISPRAPGGRSPVWYVHATRRRDTLSRVIWASGEYRVFAPSPPVTGQSSRGGTLLRHASTAQSATETLERFMAISWLTLEHGVVDPLWASVEWVDHDEHHRPRRVSIREPLAEDRPRPRALRR